MNHYGMIDVGLILLVEVNRVMRTFFQKTLTILDGTPAVTPRSRTRGQSVAELAMITPLLIILIAGIVEIGWFANNYLILLEVTRVGARRGATLTGSNAPPVWNDYASLHYIYDDNLYQDGSSNSVPLDPFVDNSFPRDAGGPPGPDETQWPSSNPASVDSYTLAQDQQVERWRQEARDCRSIGNPTALVGFYNLVLCQMLNSLDPLVINAPDPDVTLLPPEEERTDDVIISVFSVKMINNTVENCPADNVHCDNLDLTPNGTDLGNYTPPVPEFEPGWNPVVVGRWPALANECNTYLADDGTGTLVPAVLNDHQERIERDPFDYISDGTLTTRGLPAYPPDAPAGLPTFYPIEWWSGLDTDPQVVGYDAPEQMEAQRGFNFTGYHKVEGPSVSGQFTSWDDVNLGNQTEREWLCYGSEFDIYEVQDLLRTDGFILSDAEIDQMRISLGDPTFGDDGSGSNIDVRQFLHDQGVVLVEIHYQHTLLLDLPMFSPVFNALGGNTTIISVWSAFPVPAAEPDLLLNMVTTDFYDPD